MNTSSSNVSASQELRAAATWRRLLGAVIDMLLPIGLTVLVIWMMSSAGTGEGASQWNAFDNFIDRYNADPFTLWTPLVTLVFLSFTWNLSFQLTWGRTPGKALLKVSLVNEIGGPPDKSTVVLHCVTRVLSGVLFFSGHLWMFADPERRTMHDRLAGVFAISPTGPRS